MLNLPFLCPITKVFFKLNVTVTFVWGPVCSVILTVGGIDKLHISINYTLSSR
jgi:hypothetical protein